MPFPETGFWPPGGFGVFGPILEPAYLWSGLSRFRPPRGGRGGRGKKKRCGRALYADLGECGSEENRAVGRILRRLSHCDGAGAQFRVVRRRSGLARRPRLVGFWRRVSEGCAGP